MEKNEVIVALVAAQLEIKAPFRDKTGGHKNKYASIDSIYEAIRVPLANNGLTLSHTVELIGSKEYLKTTLYHTSGKEISNVMPLIIGAVTSQGFGSALTYARRYAIASLIGLSADDDEDGQESTKQQEANKEQPKSKLTITDDQAAQLYSLIGENTTLLTSVLNHNGVSKLSGILSSNFDAQLHFIKQAVGK